MDGEHADDLLKRALIDAEAVGLRRAAGHAAHAVARR